MSTSIMQLQTSQPALQAELVAKFYPLKESASRNRHRIQLAENPPENIRIFLECSWYNEALPIVLDDWHIYVSF